MWKHKKFGKKMFKGSYLLLQGERVFQLFCPENKRAITFESWQAAKNAGWIKE